MAISNGKTTSPLYYNEPLTILKTVYTQYFGHKKPLDRLAHYINIGAQMREGFWLKQYLADILSTCPSSAKDINESCTDMLYEDV